MTLKHIIIDKFTECSNNVIIFMYKRISFLREKKRNNKIPHRFYFVENQMLYCKSVIMPSRRLPLHTALLLLQLGSDVFQLQRAGDEADLTALFHQPPDPPVIIKLLQFGDMRKQTEKKNQSVFSF